MILESLIENGIIRRIEYLFSIDHKRLLHLGGTQGDVYQFTQDNTDYVLKISPIQLSYIEPLRGQAEFVNFLAKNGVNVSEYIPSIEGNHVEIIKSGSTLLGISKFIKSKGTYINHQDPSVWNRNLFEKWGQSVGKLHKYSKLYHKGGSIFTWQDDIQFKKAITHESDILRKWDEIEEYFLSLPQNNNIYGLIHNDPHLGNITFENNEVYFFDFDICIHHWFITDIAVVFFHAFDLIRNTSKENQQKFSNAFLNRFMKGYYKETDLDEAIKQEFSFFLRYRHLLMYTYWSSQSNNNFYLKKDKEMILNDTPIINIDFCFIST
ncbi:MAG: phosphotransferase enzyme family protein [Promethearchaeota archaeon]